MSRLGEVRSLSRLALPLVAGHVGNQMMGIVDTMMVGRLSKAALGGVGLGNGLFFFVAIFAMGITFGMDAPVAQALGAGEPGRARRIFWQGVRVALLVAVPATFVVGLLPLVLAPAGVDPDVTRETKAYIWTRLPSMFPMLIFGVCRGYLQAVHVTRAIWVASIFANVVNFLGNALFIYGDRSLEYVGLPGLGLPALGVAGAAMATVLAQLTSMLIVIRAVRGIDAPPDPERRRPWPEVQRLIWRLGLPIGVMNLAEIGVFAFCNVLAGRMSKEAASGHQLALQLAAFTFMFALGVGAATAVRVGQAVGRDDTPAARRAGFAGLTLILGIMAVPAVLFLVIPAEIAWLFTDDATLVAAAVPLLQIAAVFQLSDGLQAVGAGALRGAGDPRFPLWANVIGHWALGLPISLLLGLHLGWGAPGLWWGLSAGLTAVAAALVWRFARLSRTRIARV